MKRISFLVFTNLFFVLLFSGQNLFSQEPLPGFPKKSFHQLNSKTKSIGKTSLHYTQKGKSLEFTEYSEMKLKLFGKEQVLKTTVVVDTDFSLSLQSFRYSMESSDSKLLVTGKRLGDQLRLEKTQAGSPQIKNISIQEPLLLSPLIRPYALLKGFSKKPSLNISSFLLEPSALTTIPMTVSVSKQPNSKLWNLEVSYLSHQLKSLIDVNAGLVSEKTDIAGMTIEAHPITEKQFNELNLQGVSDDLVEQSKVTFPEISKPREIKELTVDITGVSLHNFQLNRHRQKLMGNRLKIEKESLPVKSKTIQSLVGKKEFEPYLMGDISVPVFDPLIQKTAREIVGNESDLWKRAQKVHQFVFSNLEKDPYVSLPDALEALQNKKGDCNEHAVLYTALARAAGIPTRIVVGLVYSASFYGGGAPGFYYHAWVEVFTGDQWIAIDPTWNQIPADATHIAFVEGGADQQIQIASLMGRIRLSPVSSSLSPNL